MERELTSRASEPPGESEEPPPERLGRDDPLGQPDPGRPASKVVGDHLDREPGAIGGEATRGQVIEPDAVLEVTDSRSRSRRGDDGRPRVRASDQRGR